MSSRTSLFSILALVALSCRCGGSPRRATTSAEAVSAPATDAVAAAAQPSPLDLVPVGSLAAFPPASWVGPPVLASDSEDLTGSALAAAQARSADLLACLPPAQEPPRWVIISADVGEGVTYAEVNGILPFERCLVDIVLAFPLERSGPTEELLLPIHWGRDAAAAPEDPSAAALYAETLGWLAPLPRGERFGDHLGHAAWDVGALGAPVRTVSIASRLTRGVVVLPGFSSARLGAQVVLRSDVTTIEGAAAFLAGLNGLPAEQVAGLRQCARAMDGHLGVRGLRETDAFRPAVELSPDGSLLVASGPTTWALCAASHPEVVLHPTGYPTATERPTFSASSRRLLLFGWDRTRQSCQGFAEVWDLASGEVSRLYRSEGEWEHGALSADGARIISTAGHDLLLSDARTDAAIDRVPLEVSDAPMVLSPEGSVVAVAHREGFVDIFDAETLAHRGAIPIRGFPDRNSMVLSGGGSVLAVLDSDEEDVAVDFYSITGP